MISLWLIIRLENKFVVFAPLGGVIARTSMKGGVIARIHPQSKSGVIARTTANCLETIGTGGRPSLD